MAHGKFESLWRQRSYTTTATVPDTDSVGVTPGAGPVFLRKATRRWLGPP